MTAGAFHLVLVELKGQPASPRKLKYVRDRTALLHSVARKQALPKPRSYAACLACLCCLSNAVRMVREQSTQAAPLSGAGQRLQRSVTSEWIVSGYAVIQALSNF